MKRVLTFTVLGLACCYLMQQVVVVAVAQEIWQEVAIDNSGAAETTKPGVADGGVRSPVLTGERRPLYRLCKSDVVEISFVFSPEFNQTVSVQPDGFVPLQGVEQLYAEGMTLPQFREAVRGLYGGMLHDPELTVILKDFNKPYFIAGGEVARPGKYELRGDATVTEAVAMAGGFNGQAKHSQVVLFRRTSEDRVEARILDVKQMLKNRNLGEDIHLKPGDLLFVPQNTISKIRRYMPIPNLSMYWNPSQF
ncbi:MAG TPA: polysaccharide biosynthesis/export family protein [Terriglobales bacterium]|nr:polysaccharide biosynthesis/export family protein [Terriglobales bacterium]